MPIERPWLRLHEGYVHMARIDGHAKRGVAKDEAAEAARPRLLRRDRMSEAMSAIALSDTPAGSRNCLLFAEDRKSSTADRATGLTLIGSRWA